MDSLENGTGVMIIHDHKLSQKQERQAEKAVGETVCLSPLKNKETCIRWNSMTDKERDKEDGIIKAETPSTEYTLSGYLDNQADDFPAEKQYTDKPGRRRRSRHFLHCKIRSYAEKCRLHPGKQNYVRKYQCNIIVCRTG